MLFINGTTNSLTYKKHASTEQRGKAITGSPISNT